MKCFTVSEREIHNFFSVVEKGIGINGKVATIADDKNFPKPDMNYPSDTSGIHPFAPARGRIIERADFYQYKDPETRVASTPIIINEKHHESGWAFVLWIVKKDGPNYFSKIWSKYEAMPIFGPVECNGYVQYLFVMANSGSDIMVKPQKSVLNLHYSHGRLKIEQH